jgi:intracellular sulfur oxidation DsrE/DsrF family protein
MEERKGDLMTKELPQTARRSFLSRFGMGAALVAGVGATLAVARPAVAQTVTFKPRRHAEDAWMESPNVAHRVVIDSAFPPGGGAALLYANNNFLANKAGYGLEAQEVAIIVVLRHLATPFAFTDAIWAKHGAALSEIIEFQNPATKAAPDVNLYNSRAAGISLTNRGVTISSLVEKNVQFAVCGSAMRFLANAIAQRTKGDADAIYKEFAANLVPNSHIAPAGVVAVNRAQEYGYTLLTAV